MLAAGAAKCYAQVLKATRDVIVYIDRYYRIDMLQVFIHPCVFLQKLLYFYIVACKMLVSFIPAGIQDAAAIEHKATAVPALVLRHATFI